MFLGDNIWRKRWIHECHLPLPVSPEQGPVPESNCPEWICN